MTLSTATAYQTTASDLTGALQSLAQPAVIGAGLVARYAGMTDGCLIDRPHWLVFEGEVEVGYVADLTFAHGTTYEWRVGGDAGWSDSLPEALAAMRAAMVELAEEQADIAARKAEIDALPEPARLAEYAAQKAEIAYQVEVHRNIINPAELRRTGEIARAWAKTALDVQLAASLEQIDAERAA